MAHTNCLICGRDNSDRPTIHRGEPTCCDNCLKKYNGEAPLTEKDLVTLDNSLRNLIVTNGEWQPVLSREQDTEWLVADGRPVAHVHVREQMRYGVHNVTQAGDEVECFRCDNCGAEATGWRTNANRDEE